MRVLLVNPPGEELRGKDWLPPLGLGYLAAILENSSHHVQIMDSQVMGWTIDEAIGNISKADPELLGLTATTQSRFNVSKILEGVKDSSCLKVLGGVHFSFTDVDALQLLPADVVARGEGENALLDLANGKSCNEIEGITYKNKEGQIIRNKDRQFLDVNKLPHPARHLFPMEKYEAKLEGEYKTKCTGILTSRGCPYNCVFCSNCYFWKRKFRRRNPIDVVNEIEAIVKNYGIRGFDFWDDTLTIAPEHVEEICSEIVNRKLDIIWYARIRVNTVNRFILNLMKKAGCVSLSFGVESGSPRVLKAIRKDITLEQVEEVARISNELGLYVKAFFMFNLPTETFEDVSLTFKVINKLGHYRNIRCVQGITFIYPGTELEMIAKKEGILPENFSWNSPIEESRYRRYQQLGASRVVPPFEHIPLEELIPFLKRERRKSFFVRGVKEFVQIRNFKDLYTLCQKAYRSVR